MVMPVEEIHGENCDCDSCLRIQMEGWEEEEEDEHSNGHDVTCECDECLGIELIDERPYHPNVQ